MSVVQVLYIGEGLIPLLCLEGLFLKAFHTQILLSQAILMYCERSGTCINPRTESRCPVWVCTDFIVPPSYTLRGSFQDYK